MRNFSWMLAASLMCAGVSCVGTPPDDTDLLAEELSVVYDNSGSSYAEVGAWTISATTGSVGANSRYNAAGTGADEAAWRFTVPTTGQYTVDAWWVAGGNRAPDAKYRVEHADGTAVVTVNQTSGGSRWNTLGNYRFLEGVTYTVRLRDDATAGRVVVADAVRVGDAWRTGGVATLPPSTELRPLPGGGNHVPAVTSNNPEIFRGTGFLYSTQYARPGPDRPGSDAPSPVSGPFAIYLHHINDLGPNETLERRNEFVRHVKVVLTNPSTTTSVQVSGRGSGYNSDETSGLQIGRSPDNWVSRDFARNSGFTMTRATTTIPPGGVLEVWSKDVAIKREVDARFAMTSTGPVHVHVVSARTSARVTSVAGVPAIAARGDVATTGFPSPPPFGREAGTYDGDTWESSIALDVPARGRRVGFFVNTATGTGLPQLQAFPALRNYKDSAREAVGMYGNFYDFALTLRHDGRDSGNRTVAIAFGSYGAGTPSRFWDGEASLDGSLVSIRNTPTTRIQTLRTYTLTSGQTRTVRLRAMVPGLTSIYQGLWIASQ